ncbi:MFS general substrate transporter [Gonapodya prolifera JEL478]|uniref:Lysosomal dipeptide transporter MFSD1 n=1 Tax=Gonapodya prolifera (strain JEL478) TaxID=1344416 RepID=A0A139AIB0_GONPJ|nr:MFS general substrate transporter [Gonapodya prolifera JEL478]|eukprot:KXS16551.1 MFS general substrate transporter [Gonapodya prolifera JEL478]
MRARSVWRQSGMLLCLAATTLGTYYCYDMPGALNVKLRDWLEIPYFDWQYSLNLLYTFYSIPNVILPLVGGLIVELFDNNAVLIFFAATVFSGHCLFAVAVFYKSLHLMYASRFLAGLGSGALDTVQMVFMTKWFDGQEPIGLGLAMCLDLTFIRIATAVSDVISPRIAEHFGVPWAALLGVATCVTSLCAVWVTIAINRFPSGKTEKLKPACKKVENSIGEPQTSDVESEDGYGTAEHTAILSQTFPASSWKAGLHSPKLVQSFRSADHANSKATTELPKPAPNPRLSLLVVPPLPYPPIMLGVSPSTLGDSRHSRHFRHLTEEDSEDVVDPSEVSQLLEVRTFLDDTANEASQASSGRISLEKFGADFWLLCGICVLSYASVFPFFAVCTDFFQDKYFHGDVNSAGIVMAIPPVFCGITAPFIGYLFDGSPRLRPWLLLTSMALVTIAHLLFGWTSTSPYVGMLILGAGFSLFSSTIWPLVPVVSGDQVGTGWVETFVRIREMPC